jgi:predicted ATP-grasp superfamily ATP-dependent carboligase
MEKVTKGYIKFTEKKAIMKPFDGEGGLVETWVASEAITNRQWFRHNGVKYQLTTSVDAKVKYE